MGKISKRKKGFTLIEVITVGVIIAIAATIAVPNFSNLIHRNQIRNIIQTAQWSENVIMSLTGMQYANSETGNPPIADWAANEIVDKENYIYVEKGNSAGLGIGPVFRVAPANMAVPNRVADRSADASSVTSAGLQEFYKRTMNILQPPSWKTGAEFEKWVTCSVYFELDNSIIISNVSGVASGKFVRYNFAYSEYYFSEGNKQYAIFHGIKFHGTGDGPGTAVTWNTPTRDMDWHVYEYDNGVLTYYGSV